MQNKETITYQILQENSNETIEKGKIVTLNVETIMAHDGTGPVVADTLQKHGITKLKSSQKAVINFDHYFPAKTEREALLQKNAREFANVNNIKLYVGEGISHHIMPEKGLVKSGTVLVGGDSHTCTAGAFGIFATGLGATDIAGVLTTGKLWLEVPEVIRIKLINSLQEDVTAYDLALEIVNRVGFNGALSKSIEYFGDGLKFLSIEERMKISNFSVEMGALTGIFDIDEVCIKWCKDNNIDYNKKLEFCNKSEEYDLEIDLSKVVPRIAEPNKPSNSKPIRDVEIRKVNQVFIGSCSGGFLEDIVIATKVLKGKKVNPNVRLLIGPATNKVLQTSIKEGYIQDLIDAGATILPTGCGSCLGNIGALADGEVEVATQNRNFTGRVGSKKAYIYLASAEQAAKIALTGQIGGR